jgi:hypothetical protein
MFSFFKKKSEKEKLMDQYNKMVDEAFKLSHIDRKASVMKQAEAEKLLSKIESMKD